MGVDLVVMVSARPGISWKCLMSAPLSSIRVVVEWWCKLHAPPLDHDGAGDVLLYRPASGQPIFGYTCNKFWRRSGKEIWQDLV